MKIDIKYEGNLNRPMRQTKGAAGIDLFNNEEEIVLSKGESAKMKTGVSIAIPSGYVGLVFVRSSMGFKYDITLSNAVGVIDSDYRGEIQVKLFNHGNTSLIIEPGDRIAQLVIMPICMAELNYVDELDKTERGEGGFGSTGKN